MSNNLRHFGIFRIFVYRKTTYYQSLKTALAGRINKSKQRHEKTSSRIFITS